MDFWSNESLKAWALRDSHVHLFLGHKALSDLVRNPSDRLNSPLLSKLQAALELNDNELCVAFLQKDTADDSFAKCYKEGALGEIFYSAYHIDLLQSILDSPVQSFQMQTIHILDAYFSLLFYRIIKHLKKKQQEFAHEVLANDISTSASASVSDGASASVSDSASACAKAFCSANEVAFSASLNELGCLMYSLAKVKVFDLSIGIHPWYMGHNESELNQELELIHELWIQENSHCSLGEIGLDGRCDTDFKLQEKTFAKILNWAYEYWEDSLKIVPLSIHCVGAHNEIMPFLKEYSARYKKGLKEARQTLKRISYMQEHNLDTHDEFNKSNLIKHGELLNSYDESLLNCLGTMHFFMSSPDLAKQYQSLGFKLGIAGHALKPQNDKKFTKIVKTIVGENAQDLVTHIEVETDYAGSFSKGYPQAELCTIAEKVVSWHASKE